MSEKEIIWGTGRRKTSVARVRLLSGNGKIAINGKKMDDYFPVRNHQNSVMAPLSLTGSADKYDIHVNVSGGGLTGQSGAVLLGIARALCKADAALEEKLRNHGLLTRDSRMKERKKYGRRKARKSFQFSKR
ncbi:30S ribosomal protein S9 [Candidatus Uabimicrobium amorphum]|uniref:Small ribosomal subunit protein uS9 n=1 Tax=Uabimicrobium amorphum TaxID=2596890 RepID=A0A5S9F5X2_UABAM|nr:30S ribosomal protein S9 [Candidatus Uabimicrobium amorphum]BBM85722.1 30S ribosomal protein S9 [Candidatus Uabimicrobium amorphum]